MSKQTEPIKVVDLTANPVEGYVGLSTYRLSGEVSSEEPFVQKAAVNLVDRFDEAECDLCKATVGGHLEEDDNGIEREAWTETVLVFSEGGACSFLCVNCAEEKGYLDEEPQPQPIRSHGTVKHFLLGEYEVVVGQVVSTGVFYWDVKVIWSEQTVATGSAKSQNLAIAAALRSAADKYEENRHGSR